MPCKCGPCAVELSKKFCFLGIIILGFAGKACPWGWIDAHSWLLDLYYDFNSMHGDVLMFKAQLQGHRSD